MHDEVRAAGVHARAIAVPDGSPARALLAAEALRELGDPATVHVVEGRPDVELASRSSEFDLIVVGSRGHGPLKRLMLGSTSGKLVRSAACPVIVVPRGAHEVLPEEPALTAGERG